MEYQICIEELQGKIYFELQHVDEKGMIETELKSESIVEMMQHVKSRKLTIVDITFSDQEEKIAEIADKDNNVRFSSTESKTIIPTNYPNKYIIKSFNEMDPNEVILLPENEWFCITEENSGWTSVLGEHK